MNELKLNPCENCRTTEKMTVITFLGTMCKIECSKCGMSTPWQKSMEEAEQAWNRRTDNE